MRVQRGDLVDGDAGQGQAPRGLAYHARAAAVADQVDGASGQQIGRAGAARVPGVSQRGVKGIPGRLRVVPVGALADVV